MKLLIPLIFGCILSLFLFLGLQNITQHSQPAFAMAGKSVPDFTLTELKTEQQLDQTVFKGSWRLLNIWASWCTYCKSEHDFLMTLQKQQIPIIGLNYRDKKSEAISVLSETGNPYLFTIFDPMGSLALDLGNTITPETYLIDRQGKLLFRYSGALNQEIWSREFEPRILLFGEKKQ